MICPDCGAVVTSGDLQHDANCPLGMAIEAIAEDDRAWFADHPGQDVRHRGIDHAEVREWSTVRGKPDIATCNRMAVWAIEPGVRFLQPFHDPEIEGVK